MDDATTTERPDLIILNQRIARAPLHKWPGLSIVVDPVADWALATTKLGRPFPAADLRVDYRRPAMKGTLKAHGKVVRLSAFSTREACVEASNGKLILSGRGTYATTNK